MYSSLHNSSLTFIYQLINTMLANGVITINISSTISVVVNSVSIVIAHLRPTIDGWPVLSDPE